MILKRRVIFPTLILFVLLIIYVCVMVPSGDWVSDNLIIYLIIYYSVFVLIFSAYGYIARKDGIILLILIILFIVIVEYYIEGKVELSIHHQSSATYWYMTRYFILLPRLLFSLLGYYIGYRRWWMED